MVGTARSRRARLLALLLAGAMALGTAACGDDDDDGGGSASAPATDAPADDDTGSPDAAPTDDDGGDAAAEGVDTCALLSEEEAAEIIGELVGEAEVDEPQGSLLGGCNYTSADGNSLSVSARPASEYEGTVEIAEDAEDVDAGEEAIYSPSVGVLMKLSGQDYFVQVLAIKGAEGIDRDLAVAAAEKVAANA